jgi:hypothetical protein
MVTLDFLAWQTRNGLTKEQAALVIELSPKSVQRIRTGTQGVGRWQQHLAETFEANRRVSDDLDVMAAAMDLAVACEAAPFGIVTGITSAALRGWSTATAHDRILAMPPHPAALTQPENVIAVACTLLPEHVELRTDVDGRTYRLADPVRTLVDAAAADVVQVRWHVQEAFSCAIADGVDLGEVRAFADRRADGTRERVDAYIAGASADGAARAA